MARPNQKRLRRVKNLIVASTAMAILLSISTYAWFIGTQTVNVSSFDIEIAVADSLALSLNGTTWSSSLNISKETLDTVSYGGHTNNWAGRGLIPMSSIGDLEDTASRLKLYEKASITSTPGGYRLLASRVDNYTGVEKDGYVVFDLFIKNLSGTQYIPDLNVLDEEAIYLTVDSEVNVAADGVPNTGIENSVRVAFAQIGRVIASTTDGPTVTGIKCIPEGGDVTGICRTAQIWEPNDAKHNINALRWYNTSCLKRTGEQVNLSASYSGACNKLTDGIAYPTYAIGKPITSADNVDVYDGAAYNTYLKSTTEGEEPNNLLVAYNYFTDAEKLIAGKTRPEFMTLAPNSITKVRVYIYIEGQDIDNFDFASVGKKISVNFGFTKSQLTEGDINYNGPIVNEGSGPSGADTTAPVISLVGNAEVTVASSEIEEYVDAGATAIDQPGSVNLTASIVKSGTVNRKVPGTYKVVYKVTDGQGNVGVNTRTVIVTE